MSDAGSVPGGRVFKILYKLSIVTSESTSQSCARWSPPKTLPAAACNVERSNPVVPKVNDEPNSARHAESQSVASGSSTGGAA